MMISVNPLQGRGSGGIDSWIDEDIRSDTEGSWREQVLNINDMISFFFSKDKDQTGRSEWFHTGYFRRDEFPLMTKGKK